MWLLMEEFPLKVSSILEVQKLATFSRHASAVSDRFGPAVFLRSSLGFFPTWSRSNRCEI